MPLTLNLLHEEQKQLQQRNRDPLKLGFLSLIGVALLFVGFYGYRKVGDVKLSSELRDRQTQWARQEPLANAAVAKEQVLNRTISAAAIVTRRIEGRFYVAPLLETVFKTVPPTVQITSLTEVSDPKNEKVGLTLEGIVAAAEPRPGADVFRKAIIDNLVKKYPDATASFRNLDDDTTTINVDGKSLPTAKFTIDVQLKRPNVTPVEAPVIRSRR